MKEGGKVGAFPKGKERGSTWVIKGIPCCQTASRGGSRPVRNKWGLPLNDE